MSGDSVGTGPPEALGATSAAALLRSADALRVAGRLDEAEAAIGDVLARFPAEFGVYACLGHIARARGDHAAALAQFEAALQVDPDHAGALTECGNELLALAELDDAERAFRRVLDRTPAAFGALAGLGHTARARGDRAAALAAFQAAAAAYPDNPDLALEAATELRALGRLAEAGAIYEGFADAATGFGALVSLGHLARQRGDRAAALSRFEQARALQPRHVGVWLEIATELADLGRLAAAEAALQEVLALAPQTVAAQLRLGHLARRRGDRAAALACFAGVVAADPSNTDVRLEIAAELRDAGRIGEAREILRSVLDRAPEDLSALLQAAQLERLAGDRPAALAAFRRALTRHPESVAGLVECAVEQRVAGDAAASGQLLRRALELAPGDLHAMLQAAEHAWLADDAAAALAICQEAVRLHPGHPAPHVQTARALALLGRLEEAVAGLAEAVPRCGPHPDIVAKHADLLYQLGQAAAARGVLGAHPEAATHFGLWRRGVELSLAVGDFAGCAAALDVAPARTAHERADVCQLRGELAAARWDLSESLQCLAEATRLNPANGWGHWLSARAALLLGDLTGAAHHLGESVRIDGAAVRLRRASPNISQSLLGQVLDEFAGDAELAARRRAVQAMPAAAARIGPALRLVRDFPGKTAAAIGLLLALRQAGELRGATASHSEVQPGPIPCKFMQFWDSPAPPPDVAALMHGWRQAHPGYAYTCYADSEADAYLRRIFAPEVVLAYRRARQPAQKADIFRLAWLYAEGGVYADADDRCLAPVAAVLGGGASLVTYQEEYGTLGNNFLAAAPRHPVIGRALRDAVAAVGRGDPDIPWLSTGPGLLTRAFAEELAADPLLPAAWLAEVVVLERHELLHVALPHAATEYKRSRKHWVRAAFGGKGQAVE